MNEPEIIAMIVHNGALYVATKTGVYIKDADGKFHKLQVSQEATPIPQYLRVDGAQS